ncbi:hypothetical protein Afil01_23700 [Actinorhabdospora filicis]|uniref:CN hydrolase domain-containing protein n=1 Tax=Actinorhabdospora filicis TaxID=1785913 RepID=A0A9W6SKB4_9ACTN|nr:carbon-nitrogen hydrolase family protein [Actinorhabdospora filicis]GLZ77563.1 hypothetical protein Afil01_23700 [Actinorhabdospora filicis]
MTFLAVAQTRVPEDPADAGAIRAAGRRIRALMRDAAADGARFVQFPEGALVYPSKHVVCARDGELGEADWSGVRWDVLAEEKELIRETAVELSVWTGFGTIHATGEARPANAFHVFSPDGVEVGRYEKRVLSYTEATYMYRAGEAPLVFEAEGLRFGVVLCVEANFPELIAEYETLGVDCVLLSVMVDDAPRARIAETYGILYNMWIGYSVPAQFSATVPSGVVAPGGGWIARATTDGRDGYALAALDTGTENARFQRELVRPWRRSVRARLAAGS